MLGEAGQPLHPQQESFPASKPHRAGRAPANNSKLWTTMGKSANPSLGVGQMMGDTIKPQSPGWREGWLSCLFQDHHTTELLPTSTSHTSNSESKSEQGQGTLTGAGPPTPGWGVQSQGDVRQPQQPAGTHCSQHSFTGAPAL